MHILKCTFWINLWSGFYYLTYYVSSNTPLLTFNLQQQEILLWLKSIRVYLRMVLVYKHRSFIPLFLKAAHAVDYSCCYKCSRMESTSEIPLSNRPLKNRPHQNAKVTMELWCFHSTGPFYDQVVWKWALISVRLEVCWSVHVNNLMGSVWVLFLELELVTLSFRVRVA